MTLMTVHDRLHPTPSCPGSSRLVPRIHVFPSLKGQDVDGRNKSGHDE
jgi:hypothetical protein